MSRLFDNDEQPFKLVHSSKIMIVAELLPDSNDLYFLAMESFGLQLLVPLMIGNALIYQMQGTLD